MQFEKNKGVFIIAEAGVNHNGDINLAKNLIDVAKDAGADCVKFQTWITEELVDVSAPKADYQKANDGEDTSQYEMLKGLELSFAQFKELKDYAEKKGIVFLSTPDEKKSLDFLADELKLPLLKVGSGEVNNLIYLKQIAQKKLPVILSTGMSYISDVEKAYYTLLAHGAPEVAILHCTSEYPAPYDSINLKAIETLKRVFPTTIGYSDHTAGIEVSVAAVAMGAQIIEKHFTLDKSLPGPDHKASLDPIELKQMIDSIRHIEQAIGDGIKKPHPKELDTKKVVQKGLYLSKDLAKGQIIQMDDLMGKRPAHDVNIDQADHFIGKKINKALSKGAALSFRDIEF